GNNKAARPFRHAALSYRSPGRDPSAAPGFSHSGDVEAVGVHHLVPGGDEVVDELLMRIGLAVDLGDGAQVRVRTEDEIDAGRGRLQFARVAVTAFESVLGAFDSLPYRAHVEQVDEEVVGERFRTRGEHAVLRLADIGVQRAQAADENRHFGRGQRQELRLV